MNYPSIEVIIKEKYKNSSRSIIEIIISMSQNYKDYYK